MRQLEQRVSVHSRLEPLDVAGVAGYISHRLHRAGGSSDRVNFTGDAVEEIYELSGGVPRVINKLSDRALYVGHLRRIGTIDAGIVRTANPDTVPPPAEPVIAPVSMATIRASWLRRLRRRPRRSKRRRRPRLSRSRRRRPRWRLHVRTCQRPAGLDGASGHGSAGRRA